MITTELKDFAGKTIFCDCETDGLYGDVTLLQVHCPDMGTFSYQPKDIPLKVLVTMLDKAHKSVWHNGAYDFSCLGWTPKLWEDTFLLAKLSYFHLDKLSLDACLYQALGSNPYDDIGVDKHTMQTSDWSGTLSAKQLEYAETDVKYLPKLFEAVKEHWLGTMVYELDKKTIETFSNMKQALPISKKKLQTQLELNNKKIEELDCPINVNSHKQVKEYLKNYLSNGDLALAEMIANDPEKAERALKVRTVRGLKKQNSFINKYLTKGEYMYGHLNVVPRSGRSNCSNDNLQQIPATLKHTIESKDGYLVYADFAQLELRMLAAVIGERTLYKLFKANEDLHNYAAKGLFGENFTKDQRQIAKIYNFASAYGASSETIRDVVLKWSGVYISDEQAKENRIKWLRQSYPGINAWQHKNRKYWMEYKNDPEGAVGYTILQRPYKAKLYTDMNNIMVSGSAAEVAKLALVRMGKKLDMSKMLMFIHDSYTYEADTLEEGKQVADIIAECMQSAWRTISDKCLLPDVPMPVNVSIDKNWKVADSDDALWSKDYA